jgi:hypothetical protein
LKWSYNHILDVRTSAHRPICSGWDTYSVCCAKVYKVNKSRPNSEADTRSSVRKPTSVDIQTLIHRTEPNRPHISSDISNFKERRDNNKNRGANTLGAHRPYSLL